MSEIKEGQVIDLTKRVTVYSSDKDPHHVTGTAMNVGILVAEKLVKNGMATAEAPKTTKPKGGNE
jgi:hypothetical protein